MSEQKVMNSRRSFDHLVGERQKLLWNFNAESLSSSQIQNQLHRVQRSVRPDDVGRGRLFSMMMRLAGPLGRLEATARAFKWFRFQCTERD
jgi:hypothetical protein